MTDVRQLGALALVLVVASFIIAVGGEMLTQLQDQQTEGTAAYNASEAGIEGITTFSTWIPLIALVIVLSIVIGVIVRYMGGASGGM